MEKAVCKIELEFFEDDIKMLLEDFGFEPTKENIQQVVERLKDRIRLPDYAVEIIGKVVQEMAEERDGVSYD